MRRWAFLNHSSIFSLLPGALLPWYHLHKRNLPWRQDRQPYHIWVSEIMLQQTRVEAVKGYYARFLERLPDIASLASCDDDTLLKLWEGLGYYSRVRNLKEAAQQVMDLHQGVFPATHAEVLSLPGIGEYTAGAICSIAYNLPTPAVDGNVLRVCSRLLNDPSPIDLPATKKRFTAALAAVYPEDAGDFTQALMELGATICGPNCKPDCGHCPCQDFCMGFRNCTAEALPVKSPRKEKRREQRTVFILSCAGQYALEKRPVKGLLAGLWQFPNIAGHPDTAGCLDAVHAMGLQPADLLREVRRTHIFTHIVWDMKGIYLEVADTSGDFHWFTEDEINTTAALPTAFRLFWEELTNV